MPECRKAEKCPAAQYTIDRVAKAVNESEWKRNGGLPQGIDCRSPGIRTGDEKNSFGRLCTERMGNC